MLPKQLQELHLLQNHERNPGPGSSAKPEPEQWKQTLVQLQRLNPFRSSVTGRKLGKHDLAPMR
ncbi:hypothetical protein INR49_006390 [Caranx melampygus]|nr:hypothetical protein INR49_006390 [Caranx melampygus]